MLSCEHNVAHNVAHAGFCLNRVDHSTGAPVIRDRLSYIARLLASRLWIYIRICPADAGIYLPTVLVQRILPHTCTQPVPVAQHYRYR
jgi:hypothetical protein